MREFDIFSKSIQTPGQLEKRNKRIKENIQISQLKLA